MTNPSSPAPSPRCSFRWQFLLGIFVALCACCIIFWNRFQLSEQLRLAQLPAPERGQRKQFADQMDALQSRGEYNLMRFAAAKWRKTHPADPNGWASDAFAAYYVGDLDACTWGWRKAAAMDPLIGESAGGWLSAVTEVRSHWSGPIPPPQLFDSDLVVAERKWQKEGETLLHAHKYDEIEGVESGLLRSGVASPDGRWWALIFFDGITEDEGEGAKAEKTEVTWKRRLGEIEAWRAARPRSDLARLALAECWIDGAWLARGEGYADTIGASAYPVIAARLKQASPLLHDEIGHGGHTPLFSATFHNYSLLAGGRSPLYDRIMNREYQKFPTCPQLVYNRAARLLPRWEGKPGDWEAFAAQTADQLGGVPGDMLYARTVWRVQRVFGFQNMWKESSASWPRTRRGFEALLQRFPGSLSVANAYFVFALAARDRALARHILKDHLGGRVDREVWQNIGYFARARMDVLRYP